MKESVLKRKRSPRKLKPYDEEYIAERIKNIYLIRELMEKNVRKKTTPADLFQKGIAACSDCGKLQSSDNYKCSNCGEITFWLVENETYA